MWGLGEEEQNPLVKCANDLKDGDYETAAGRRKVNKQAAGCAADAVCAIYSQGAIPPGICGPIGEFIGEYVGKAFEAIFGSDKYEKWVEKKTAQQSKQNQQDYIRAALSGYDMMVNATILTTVTAMIAAWDASVPGQKGKLGGGAIVPVSWNPTFHVGTRDYSDKSGGSSHVYDPSLSSTEATEFSATGGLMFLFDEPIQFETFTAYMPAANLLISLGADIHIGHSPDGSPFAFGPNFEAWGLWTPETLKHVEEKVFPEWIQAFQAVAGKAQMFVTEAAAREQTKTIIEKHQKQLVSAQLVGAEKSQTMNRVLLGAGAAALLGAWYVTRGKKRR